MAGIYPQLLIQTFPKGHIGTSGGLVWITAS
jgi:hypothetical protein